MRTAVPANSRRNIQRTRRAEKLSVGIMSTEAQIPVRPVLQRNGFFPGILVGVSEFSMAESGTPNLKRTFRLPFGMSRKCADAD